MSKAKIISVVGIGIILLVPIIYLFYFSKPGPLLTDEQWIAKINDDYSEADASIVQETIMLDERHVVVPFISGDGKYGLSYWEWAKRSWHVIGVYTGWQPLVWKINEKDASTYHFIWNINPSDQLDSMKLYMLRDRGFTVSDYVENYEPKIQMEKSISLAEKSYGVMQLPAEWASFVNALSKINSTKQFDPFFNNFYPDQYLYFGWIAYDEQGKETFPEQSVNGYGYGDGSIEYMQMLDVLEIDSP